MSVHADTVFGAELRHCITSDITTGRICRFPDTPIVYYEHGEQSNGDVETWASRAEWVMSSLESIFQEEPGTDFCVVANLVGANNRYNIGAEELRPWADILKMPQLNRVIGYNLSRSGRNIFWLYVALTGQMNLVDMAASEESAHEKMLDWKRLHGYI